MTCSSAAVGTLLESWILPTTTGSRICLTAFHACVKMLEQLMTKMGCNKSERAREREKGSVMFGAIQDMQGLRQSCMAGATHSRHFRESGKFVST
jgi:hypothetical protein